MPGWGECGCTRCERRDAQREEEADEIDPESGLPVWQACGAPSRAAYLRRGY